jgi:hypothetical protein
MMSLGKQLQHFGGVSLDYPEKEYRILLQEVGTHVRIDKFLQFKSLESSSTIQGNSDLAKRHFGC